MQTQAVVTVAFLLAFLKSLAPGTEKYATRPVLEAITQVATTQEDAALLAT